MSLGPSIFYEPPIYRPPSEWQSLLIQVTIGCSNNKCTYCDMYRSKNYRVRTFCEISKDLKQSFHYYSSIKSHPDKIFLCDGDALGAPMDLLVQTLDEINLLFPKLRRVGVYATAENILSKSEKELKLLASKKLTMVYLGLESGADLVLHMIVKGNTSLEMKEASLKIKKCGFKLSTIAMLGVGGREHSKDHVRETAKMLEETSPHFFSFLTTFAVVSTPYYKMIERKLITPLTSRELLQEMYEIISRVHLKSNSIIFRANHVSNMHPLGGILPKDTLKILSTIQEWIDQTPEGLYPKMPAQM